MKRTQNIIVITILFMSFFGSTYASNNGDDKDKETSKKESVHQGLTDFLFDYLSIRYEHVEFSNFLYVAVRQQTMYHIVDGKVITSFKVSTAKNGIGCKKNSEKTPIGLHHISSKAGKDVPIGGIIKGRHFTGEIAEIVTQPISTNSDDITTRALRLDGREEGLNKGGDLDSHDRAIYIHGTPEEGLISQPASHGCIRMKNNDVADLFEEVTEGTLVIILNN
jgi:hypothetical protein